MVRGGKRARVTCARCKKTIAGRRDAASCETGLPVAHLCPHRVQCVPPRYVAACPLPHCLECEAARCRERPCEACGKPKGDMTGDALCLACKRSGHATATAEEMSS